MKKLVFLLAAIILTVSAAGCSGSKDSKSSSSEASASSSDNSEAKSSASSEASGEAASETGETGNTSAGTEGTAVPAPSEEVTYVVDSDTTEEISTIERYREFFLKEKADLEKSKNTMVSRGQYESFEARDLSKYGIWEFEPWRWTDHYGKEYQYPVLYNAGQNDECLLIEGIDGHLYRFTCYSQMLKLQDLGLLNE